MDTSLETLRDALLLGLILMLVYILYRRLIHRMGKKEGGQNYAQIKSHRVENGQLTLEIDFPVAEKVVIEFRDSENERVSTPYQKEHTAGESSIVLTLDGLNPGKYQVVFKTSNHQVSRPFSC